MGAALGICSKTEDCCVKYVGQSCPKGGKAGTDDYCSKTFPCPKACGKGKFRESPTSNCGEYKPGCGINEYKGFTEDSRCRSIDTRDYLGSGKATGAPTPGKVTVVDGFANYKKGHSGVCPYKIIRIILFLLFMYLLFRRIKSRK